MLKKHNDELDKEIKLEKEINYLDLVIDKQLTWNGHLEHVESNINRIILFANRMMWMKQDVKIGHKLNIYNKVFLSIVKYASGTWFPDINNQITKTQRLRRMQRKMINAITGAYKLASTEKLLGLLNICYVDQELEIEIKSKEIEKSERKQS